MKPARKRARREELLVDPVDAACRVLALRPDMTMTGLDALPYRRIIRPPWPIDPDEERTA